MGEQRREGFMSKSGESHYMLHCPCRASIRCTHALPSHRNSRGRLRRCLRPHLGSPSRSTGVQCLAFAFSCHRTNHSKARLVNKWHSLSSQFRFLISIFCASLSCCASR